MLVIPDPDTAVLDPFCKEPTLSLTCNIQDPITRAEYSRDPRNISRKAEAYVKSTGVGDAVYFGPEPEFFIFNGIRYDTNQHSSYFFIDSEEGFWNSGKEGHNLGYKPRYKEGYFPVPPNDSLQDIRTEMVRTMEQVGIIGREAASRSRDRRPGRNRHALQDPDQDGRLADLVQIHLQQRRHPSRHDRDLHAQADFRRQRLWHALPSEHLEGRHAAVRGQWLCRLLRAGMHYIAGVLHHARSIAAFTNPGTNSYRRLVPGFEAPINLAYSSRNRSAAARIPMYSPSPKAKRVEVRFPDPTCNPYLGFTAMLMAGLDGIQRKLDPGQPLDKDIYALTPAELAEVPSMPASLDEALDNLKRDHEYLLKGDVFTEDVIETWIDYKMNKEVSQVRLRPHPYEFALYFDA